MRTRLSAVRGLLAIVLCSLLAQVPVQAPASANGALASPLRADNNPAITTTSVPSAPAGGQTTTITSTTAPSTTTTTTTPPVVTVPAVTVPDTTVPIAPATTTTSGSTTSTTMGTPPTTVDPQALANLIQSLDGAVAEAQAVNQYLA